MLPNMMTDFFAQHQDLLWVLVVAVDLGLTLVMFRLFGKMGLYGVIVLNIMLSNLQGPKLTTIFGLETSLGLILYAGIYFATDLLSERYGKREANRAVMMGFATSLIVVAVMSFSLMFLPVADKPMAVESHEALMALFSFTPHFVLGSLFVYLVSQNLDVWVFHYLKERTNGRHLWLRNNVSTLTSQAVDTVLYTLVVWWPLFLDKQPELSVWDALEIAFYLALAKYFFKVLIALIDTPFIYWARTWNVDEKDWHSELEQAPETRVTAQPQEETPKTEAAPEPAPKKEEKKAKNIGSNDDYMTSTQPNIDSSSFLREHNTFQPMMGRVKR